MYESHPLSRIENTIKVQAKENKKKRKEKVRFLFDIFSPLARCTHPLFMYLVEPTQLMDLEGPLSLAGPASTALARPPDGHHRSAYDEGALGDAHGVLAAVQVQ